MTSGRKVKLLKARGFFFFFLSLLLFILKHFFFTYRIMFVNGYSDRHRISESTQILMEAATETRETGSIGLI